MNVSAMSRVAIMLRFAIWSIVMVATTSYSLTLFGHRAAAPVARRARSNLMPLNDSIVEECILAANNEDEVQDCMSIMDELDDVPLHVVTSLAECLKQAAHWGGEAHAMAVDECVLASDEGGEANYG